MTIVEALFLGAVQGLTEFLPVSSSGHLVLSQQLLGLSSSQLTFDVWLHFSTLLAVIVFFWHDLWRLTQKDWWVILAGSLPVFFIGLLMQNTIEAWFGSVKLVAVALIVTGVMNLSADAILKRHSQDEKMQAVGLKQGLLVGLFQALAITPGISRSGATVFAGLWQKLDRSTAFRFSFLLSTPAILGANLLQLIKVWEQEVTISLPLLMGAAAAFVTGLLGLFFFKKVMQRTQLSWFGYYCLLIGSLFSIGF